MQRNRQGNRLGGRLNVSGQLFSVLLTGILELRKMEVYKFGVSI